MVDSLQSALDSNVVHSSLLDWLHESRAIENAQSDAEAKPLQRLLSSLVNAVAVKSVKLITAMKILLFLMPRLAAADSMLWLAENLASRLVTVLNGSSRCDALDCATLLVERLSGLKTHRKQLSVFVNALSPAVLEVLDHNDAEAISAAVDFLICSIAAAPGSMQSKAGAMLQRASVLMWKNEDGARLLVAVSLLVGGSKKLASGGHFGGDGSAAPAGASVTISAAGTLLSQCVASMSRVANQVCAEMKSGQFTNDVEEGHPLRPPARALANDVSAASLEDYHRLADVFSCIVSGGWDSAYEVPVGDVVRHFVQVLVTDMSVGGSPHVVALKRRCLSIFPGFCEFAKASLLLQHSLICEMFLSAARWAKAHSGMTLTSLVAAYAAFVRHVPAGHAEAPVFYALLNGVANDVEVLCDVLEDLVSFRPGLWSSLHQPLRSAIESLVVLSALDRKNPKAARTARALFTCSSVLQSPTSALLVPHVSPNLGQLALVFRPPAPVWPLIVPGSERVTASSSAAPRNVFEVARLGAEDEEEQAVVHPPQQQSKGSRRREREEEQEADEARGTKAAAATAALAAASEAQNKQAEIQQKKTKQQKTASQQQQQQRVELQALELSPQRQENDDNEEEGGGSFWFQKASDMSAAGGDFSGQVIAGNVNDNEEGGEEEDDFEMPAIINRSPSASEDENEDE